MTAPLLQLQGISKRFEGNYVLRDVNISLEAGQTQLILGENGAGKSTLMKIIGGVFQPDGGRILLNGAPTMIASPYHAHKLGITSIYQEPNLFPNLSITENLHLHCWIKGLPLIRWKMLHQDSINLLGRFGMDLNPQTLVARLSLGEKQMIEIIRAFSRQSKILIMDEATAALTEAEVQIILKLIKEVSTLGVGVFFVSQRLEDMYRIGERVTVIRDGAVVRSQTQVRMPVNEAIEVMAGEPLAERYPKIRVEMGRKVLEVRNLGFQSLLRNVSFELRRGEILGLTGLMGSGRSLLGQILFGIQKATAGEIVVQGKRFSNPTPRQAIRRGICYVAEDRKNKGLFMPMSVKDNITITQLNRFISKGLINLKREEETAREYIRKLVIKADSLATHAESLSGGNQQKVILAKWFNSGAQLFILDEPTRGIDIASKTDIYSIINKLILSGAAILLISSDLNELVGMCDRILILKNGTIYDEILRKEATVNKILRLSSDS